MEVPVKDLVEEIHNRLPIDSAKQGCKYHSFHVHNLPLIRESNKCQSTRSRCYSNFTSAVSQMSIVTNAIGAPLPRPELHTLTMLRCYLLSTAASTRSAMGMPHLQEGHSFWEAGGRFESSHLEVLKILFLTLGRYVKDILHRTPISQDTITIRPNDELHLNSSNRDSMERINSNLLQWHWPCDIRYQTY